MSDELNRERQELVDLARRFGLPQTVSGEPFPASQEGAPLIVDTDAGGDPDDTIALVAAAAEPTLALVSTVDEVGGQRARFIRRLLDALGREDVAVVAGAGQSDIFSTDDQQDLTEEVVEVMGSAPLTRLLAIGPATNVAKILTTRPDLADRLVITQLGGEHNFGSDPEAAKTLLAKAALPKIVVTGAPAIDRDSEIVQRLADPDAPEWARLVSAHLAQWFDREGTATVQNAALALAAALQLPFVALSRKKVTVDDGGAITAADDGRLARVSVKVNQPAFLTWLTGKLEAALEKDR